MPNPIPALFSMLAIVNGGLCLLAVAAPQWLERAVGLSPDGGDGSMEWALALSTLVGSLGFAALARRSRRRARIGVRSD